MKLCFRRLLPVLLAVMLFCGAQASAGDMPFNGEMAFHKISLAVPESFIRDSTQSTDDFWVFEKGWYSQYIMLSCSALNSDAGAYLDGYMKYLHAQGADSHREDFLGLEAVRSSQMDGGRNWQELMFVHDGSVYAVALQGGTEDAFSALLDTVAVHEEEPQIAAKADGRGPLRRMMDYLFDWENAE